MTTVALLAIVLAFATTLVAAGPRPEPDVVIGARLATTAVTRAPTIFNFHAASPGGFWHPPVDAPGNISSAYGPRWKFSSTRDDFHRGIDYFGPDGVPIYSIAAGTVFQVHTEAGGTMSGGGNVVVIQHPVPASLSGIHPFHDRSVTVVFAYYLHLETIDPAMVEGANVTAGQRVGGMGQTGETSFTHLHFETRLQGYCSYQFQWARNRTASPTSFCNTGFDPHVHPYHFVGDNVTGGERRLFATTGFNATGVVASVRYCADRGKLDLDVVETNLGTLRIGTRAGMTSINTEEELDALSNITSWLNLRPQQLGSGGSEHCYDLGFKGSVPTYLEVRGIDGTGVRTDDVTGVAGTAAAGSTTTAATATTGSSGTTAAASPGTTTAPGSTTTTAAAPPPPTTTAAPTMQLPFRGAPSSAAPALALRLTTGLLLIFAALVAA